jgi:hypothetical protein
MQSIIGLHGPHIGMHVSDAYRGSALSNRHGIRMWYFACGNNGAWEHAPLGWVLAPAPGQLPPSFNARNVRSGHVPTSCVAA